MARMCAVEGQSRCGERGQDGGRGGGRASMGKELVDSAVTDDEAAAWAEVRRRPRHVRSAAAAGAWSERRRVRPPAAPVPAPPPAPACECPATDAKGSAAQLRWLGTGRQHGCKCPACAWDLTKVAGKVAFTQHGFQASQKANECLKRLAGCAFPGLAEGDCQGCAR